MVGALRAQWLIVYRLLGSRVPMLFEAGEIDDLLGESSQVS